LAIKSRKYSKILRSLAFIIAVATACIATICAIRILSQEEVHSLDDLIATHVTETVALDFHAFTIENKIREFIDDFSVVDEVSFDDMYFETRQQLLAKELGVEYDLLYDVLDGLTDIPEKVIDAAQDAVTEEMVTKVLMEQTQSEWNKMLIEQEARLQDLMFDSPHHSGILYHIQALNNYTDITHVFTNIKDDDPLIMLRDYRYHYQVDDIHYFAFTDDYIQVRNDIFHETVKSVKTDISLVIISLILFLISIIYLVFTAGMNNKLIFVDKIYSELTLGLFIISSIIGIQILFSFLIPLYFYENRGSISYTFAVIFSAVILAAFVAFFIAVFLTIIRHIKRKTLFKQSLIGKLIRKLYRWCDKIYSMGSPAIKIIIAVVGFGLLTMIPFVGIVTVPLAVYLTYRQINRFMQIKSGVDIIKSGIYTRPIVMQGNSELAMLASNINEIASGLGEEVERRLKSERLKTELIVNVSHDIKTPLTSIITYVDLLQKEGIDNEIIQGYTDILANKSNRLKMLIDDLFEASKAASGNVNVNFEKVDVLSLINQGLGEMNDKVKASSLEFIMNFPETRLLALADGRLLWRVLENLLSNTLKYSLEHSRVYIDAHQDGDKIYVEVKNISAHQLNIPADEITERFKRGDLSRSSEGSGLGLDIAKSLMLCQKGNLDIKIDGDLFKVTISVNKYSESEKIDIN